MPPVQGNQLAQAAWDWIAGLLRDPERLWQGAAAYREEQAARLAPLREQVALIDDLLLATEHKRQKWLDLYEVAGGRGLEMEDIAERLKMVANERNRLLTEREDVASRLSQAELTDDDVASIEAFASDVAVGLEAVTFKQKVQIFDLLGVKGVVQLRGGQKKPEVLLSCRLPIGEALLSGGYPSVSSFG